MPSRLLAPAAIVASAAAYALYSRVEFPWVLLGWCGLVPWLAALDRAPTLARALGSGLLFCVAFVFAVFFWFAEAMANYTGAPLAVAALVLLLLAPLLQPQFLVFAALRHVLRRAGAGDWQLALAGAGVYVGAEWAWPKLFADTIGHGLYAAPLLRQAADLGGAPLLTFALLVVNACVWAALSAASRSDDLGLRRFSAACAGVVLPIAALAIYGGWRADGAAAQPALRVGIAQGNLSHYERLAAELGTYDAVQLILAAYFELSRSMLARSERAPLDLLVWPETVYPTTYGTPKSADGAELDSRVDAFVQRAGVPLVFGAYDAENGAEFNAAVLVEPGAERAAPFAAYRKASLFPLTERVPSWLDSPAVRGVLPWLGTWSAGSGPRVLPLRLRDGRTLRIAPLICYDAVDPRLAIAAVREGAEVIVTLSNDAWFAAGGGPQLHLIVSAFRSIETRRPQVRVTNTGISAVITASGDMLGSIDSNQRGTLVAEVVPERTARTLMLAWGNWFGPAALALAVCIGGRAVARRASHKA